MAVRTNWMQKRSMASTGNARFTFKKYQGTHVVAASLYFAVRSNFGLEFLMTMARCHFPFTGISIVCGFEALLLPEQKL